MKKNTDKPEADNLRQKAEDLFSKKTDKSSLNLDKVNSKKLIQELEIHQIELEMQNEELLQARLSAQTTAEKYLDLYDFAPSGYFTLTNTGKIIDLNLSAAKMLGKPRKELTDSQFSSFLSDDTKSVFNKFFEDVFNKRTTQICQVTINIDTVQMFIKLSGVVDENSTHCLLTAIDFTTNVQSENFSNTLLSSLPYPAMYIRQKDKIILAANKLAIHLGAKVGGHCWREFGQTEFISEKEKEISQEFPDRVPVKFDIKCSFCQADECIFDSPCQNHPGIKAFNRIWNTYWIKVSEDTFLHYVIDVTEQKQLEESLRESEQFLQRTQQIARLGTYTLDVLTGKWVTSEIMNNIMGIDTSFDKTVESWGSLIHPEYQQTMIDYFANHVLGEKNKFDKEYKIIRQNDQEVRWVHGLGDLVFNENQDPIKMIGTIQDVTERKQADEERKLLFAAVENTDNRVVIKDLNLRVIAANEAWILSRGEKSIKNLLGKTDAEILKIPADSEPVRTWMEEDKQTQLLAPGEFMESEVNMKLNGEQIIATVKRFPIFNGNGKLFCTGLISTDITELKQKEQALRESEQYLLQTQQIARLGTYTLDILTGKWVCSEILNNIMGIEASFDKTVESWISIIHPEYQQTMADYFANYVLGEKGKFDREYKIIRPNDKEVRWVHELGDLVFNENQEPIKMIGTLRDITERKQADEERKLLLGAIENTDSRIVVKDLNLRVIAANNAWVLSRGETNIKNLLGKTDAEVLNIPASSEPVYSWMEEDKKTQLLAPGESIQSIFPLELKEGEKFIYSVKRFPIFDEKGKVFCTGVVSTDITELKQKEQALRKSELFLKQTQQIAMLGTFTLDISLGHWESSDVLNTILGIDADYDKTTPSWKLFIHPEWKKSLYYTILHNNNGTEKNTFNKEFKIIRQSDQAERWVHGIGNVEFNDKKMPVRIIGTIRDVTERKNEQAMMIRSHKFVEALLKSMPTPVFFKNTSGAYLGCNEAFSTVMGVSEEEIKGKTVMDLWPGKQAKIYHENDLKLLANEEFQTYESTITDAQKRIREVIYAKNVFYDENGNISGIIGTFVDITERKQMENALRESEMFLKQTQQIAMLGTFTLDISSGQWVSSEVLDTLFGIDNTYDKTFENWINIVHPEWRKTLSNFFVLEMIGIRTKFDKEYKIIRQSDKAERWVHGIGTLEYNSDNEPVRMIGTIRDITERKQAEEERKFLFAAIENTDNIISVKDLNLKIVAVNQAFINASKESSVKDIIGKTDEEIFGTSRDIEPVRTYMADELKAQTLKPGEYILREEPLILPDGRERVILTKKFPIFDTAGNLFCTGSVATDITERKQAEEERRFLSAAVENTDHIIVVKDLNLRVLATNQAFANAAGHSSPKTMIGKNDAEIYRVSPDTEPIRSYMEDERIAQKLLPGESLYKEEPLILPDGSTRTLLTRKYPIFDSEGKLFATGNVSTDITDRKKAEEALWLKNISFDSAIASNSIAGVDGIITEVNEAFLLNFGYKNKNEVIGKTFKNFINDTTEADIIISTLINAGQWEGDYTAKKGDDSTFDAHGLATAIKDKNGDIIGYQSSIIDITDRKQAEDALRKSEQMLLAILDHFPGVVFWKDTESTYLGCNQNFAHGAGLNSTAEIVGKTDFDLPWNKDEAAKYRADDLEIIEKGIAKLHYIETQHQADGKVIWFDSSKIPLRENGGSIMGVIGVSNDITDRKLAEDALKESEEKYRTIANFTDDWEYWLDPNENFIYCSPSCEKITGYNAIEFIQDPELLDKIMYPEDLASYQKHRKERLVTLENTEFQFRIIHFKGEVRWIGHVCQPVYNDSGVYVGIRGSNRDITERKKIEEKLKNSERKYKLISLNITDGVFISKDGYFEYVNYSMSNIFGYEESEIEKLKLAELVIPERRDDFEKFISFDPDSDQVNNLEIECLRKDNSIVFVEIFLNHVASEMLTYGVVHDITKKKQLQEKNMVKAIIQTEEKERANFSKELHDGLGPLLSTIKLYLQWSIRPKSNRSRKEIIFKAEEILEEALTAVKEISNKLSPHLLTNYGLTSAVQSFINKLTETNAVKIDFQSNVTRRIEIEIEVALYRATIECINNTIKYAKANHIHIQMIDMGNMIQLQYRDDGKGFDIIKILSEKKGLGLYNLQNRIQTIGGEIKMFSTLHEGVNYHINVPVKKISQNNTSDKI